MNYRIFSGLALLLLLLGCTYTTEKVADIQKINLTAKNETGNASIVFINENVSIITETKTNISEEFVYYYSSKCSASNEVFPLFNEIKGNFSKYVTFKEYDVTTKDGLASFRIFLANHNITKAYVPTIIIGNQILVGLGQMTRANMYSAMFKHLAINESDFEST